MQLEPLEPRQLLAVVISEFMADNESTIQDEDGDFSDWIEVRNTAGDTVNLDGWYVTDDAEELTKWRFPNINLGANEHLLLYASSKDRRVAGDELHTNFRLSNNGEYLALVQPDGATIEYEYAPQFPAQSNDVSYGVSADLSTVGYFVTPTPAAPNTGDPIADPSRAIAISEIMYHPSSDNSLEEYIEIHNRGSQTVSLVGWQLDRGADFTFPDVSLNAGQYLVVAADIAAFSAKYPGVSNVVGGWSGRLSNQSDRIDLLDEFGARVDMVEYADQGDWAVRKQVIDGGEAGWVWEALHDGGDEAGNNGKSLELVNPAMPNQYGQNWTASIPNNGTPGTQNSVNDANIAPSYSMWRTLRLSPVRAIRSRSRRRSKMKLQPARTCVSSARRWQSDVFFVGDERRRTERRRWDR